MQLENRTAIVTGGSSGIGRSIALEFAREGADVMIGDVQRAPKDKAEETPTDDLIQDLGREAMFTKTDVTQVTDGKKLVESTVEAFGGVDIVVNNAGIFPPGSVDTVSEEDWDQTFATNVKAIYIVTKPAVAHLRDSEAGRILNLSSQLGLVGRANAAAYCASKGAVVNLTRQMAIDYASDKITVNAISPGIIRTSMTAEKLADESRREPLERDTLLPFFGDPTDIGRTAVFLASDDSRYVTGHCLVIDGGYTVH
ncbi:SDR family NAD(P)-dependent oxidoreductase [Haladaptatus halobius]|uniref:SDR family NAD(P)-dependent oxidoreductase n=1 Tax=Haladaptatus halobius TaxID=2884875 RepID=UPI001D0BC8B2|nr:SDR family oxidoreductase [Haladaptatus halobius]